MSHICFVAIPLIMKTMPCSNLPGLRRSASFHVVYGFDRLDKTADVQIDLGSTSGSLMIMKNAQSHRVFCGPESQKIFFLTTTKLKKPPQTAEVQQQRSTKCKQVDVRRCSKHRCKQNLWREEVLPEHIRF